MPRNKRTRRSHLYAMNNKRRKLNESKPPSQVPETEWNSSLEEYINKEDFYETMKPETHMVSPYPERIPLPYEPLPEPEIRNQYPGQPPEMQNVKRFENNIRQKPETEGNSSLDEYINKEDFYEAMKPETHMVSPYPERIILPYETLPEPEIRNQYPGQPPEMQNVKRFENNITQKDFDASENQNVEEFHPSRCKETKRYWDQRYKLFSRYDQGIKLDKESWFSVTPEEIACDIAKRCSCGRIIDAFCGAGGNAIQFASSCNSVLAIDIDPKKIELAQNNARVYEVETRITFLVGDFLTLAPWLKADFVFLSPPWGGPSYLKEKVYDISRIKPDIYKTFEAAKQITNNIALYAPKNSDRNQLRGLAKDGNCVLRLNFSKRKKGKQLKAITAYYGDLVGKKGLRIK